VSVLDALETDLLGRAALSFDAARRRGDWSPEPGHAACWRCAGGVGPHESDGDGCAACRGERLPWERAVRLAAYDDEIVRGAVLDLKYRGWRRTGRELGRALGARLAAELTRTGVGPGEAVIVPVPMPWRRRVARGVDHTLVLARGASRASGCRVVRALAARNHPRQVGLSATARRANIRGGFRVRRRAGKGLVGADRVRVVIVLDDVCTTQATLAAACTTLRRGAGGRVPAVWAACVAVSTDRDRRGPGGQGNPEGQGVREGQGDPEGQGVREGFEIGQEVGDAGLTRRG